MKINVIKRILMILVIYTLLFTIKCYAGSFSISATPTTVEPNATVTIKITGNNVTGRINLTATNISLSASSVWVENNTQTVTGIVTGTSGSKATITATPAVDNLVDSTTADTITGAKSATITIKKEEPKQETPAQTTTSETNNNTLNNNSTSNSSNASSNSTTTTTNKKTNTTNNNTITKTDTSKKEETVQNEYVEDQGTISEFGITSLYIYSIDENEEKNEIEISPKFDINTNEYNCNVTENIKKVEIIYEANEYKDLVKIEGLENDLISGENIITIKMNDNNGKEKTYKITVTKEVPKVAIPEEVIGKNEEKEKYEESIIKIPVIWFIVLQLGIIAINVLISLTIYKIKKKKWINVNVNN